MHDWTLTSLEFEWASGVLVIFFKDSQSAECAIKASGVTEIHVPRKNEWGESVSVNTISGPTLLSNNMYKLEIEMQSGDLIEILAASIILPKAV